MDDYSGYLRRLRLERRLSKALRKAARPKRVQLSPGERKLILAKTGGRCHICGGDVGPLWHADHVFAFSKGGGEGAENFLAAHLDASHLGLCRP